MKRVKSFAVWFNLAWPNWFSNGSREELVSTDYLGRSIVSLVTVRQLSNAFRLSAYLVTLRMTRVLEFPRASSRNGIQTLRVIPRPSTSRKLIRTIRGYRAPILISSRSREKILESGYLRKGRPSIISPIGLAVSPRRNVGRGDLSASIGNFSIVSIPESGVVSLEFLAGSFLA